MSLDGKHQPPILITVRSHFLNWVAMGKAAEDKQHSKTIVGSRESGVRIRQLRRSLESEAPPAIPFTDDYESVSFLLLAEMSGWLEAQRFGHAYLKDFLLCRSCLRCRFKVFDLF